MQPELEFPHRRNNHGSDPRGQALPEVRLVSAFLSGPILQVTATGFSLQTPKPPRVGESYPCDLRINGRKAEFQGLVRWCLLKEMAKQPNGDVVPTYYAGITVGEADLTAYQQLLGFLPTGSCDPN